MHYVQAHHLYTELSVLTGIAEASTVLCSFNSAWLLNLRTRRAAGGLLATLLRDSPESQHGLLEATSCSS